MTHNIPHSRIFIAGSRSSSLAIFQSNYWIDAIRSADRSIRINSITVDTAGDHDRVTPLPAMGGEGVFTAALERALSNKTIDFAVHSLKDVPVTGSSGIGLSILPIREDPRDVLIAREEWTLDSLPFAARVGTCSTRRTAQILRVRPDLTIAPLRGNIETRIARLHEGKYDAIVLAAAGIHRLGLESVISEYISPQILLPAPAQGALAVHYRSDDYEAYNVCSLLSSAATTASVTAERSFLKELGGGCATPVSALATISGNSCHLTGRISAPDGSKQIEVVGVSDCSEAKALGISLAIEAIHQGAGELLQ